MKTATPYERHAELDHHMTRHSPNGVDIIEECSDCGMRWLHNPAIGYPVTMDAARTAIAKAQSHA